MDRALTPLDNDVQEVVSSSEGNASAAIAALAEQGMAGTVPDSGLDRSVQVLRLNLPGEQRTALRSGQGIVPVDSNVEAAHE